MNEVAEKKEDRLLGFYPDMDFEEYRKAPGMNNSGLKDFRRSPLTFQHGRLHPRPETRDFRVGHAFHCLVFEPEKFKAMYKQAKYPDFRTKEAKIWKETCEQMGYTVLSSFESDNYWNVSEWDMVHRMAESVRNHPFAGVFCDDGYFESSGFFIDRGDGDVYEGTGKLCKFRMDNYNDAHSCIVDLKSTNDASYSGFQRSCHKFDYNIQEAFYTGGAASKDLNLDIKNGMFFVVVEKEPPYQCAVYKLDPQWVRQGSIQIQNAMLEYARCKESGEWPGYGYRNEIPVRDLAMPGYAKFQEIY